MHQFGQGHKYGPATNTYNAIRPRLSLATLMFNRQVWGIMPVLDCKPIRQDCDDDYHNRLVYRQQRNSNDASPVFACIPIGSAVAVQWEDGGPWTHGTIVGTDNHNHHNRSYTITLTTNGRHITQNRWHIKPTAVTTDTYLQHQSNKQYNIKTDQLADILNNINKNPTVYANVQTPNINNSDGQDHEQINSNQKQEAKDRKQCVKRTDISRKEGACIPGDSKAVFQGSEVLKTRSWWVVRKPYRLAYV